MEEKFNSYLSLPCKESVSIIRGKRVVIRSFFAGQKNFSEIVLQHAIKRAYEDLEKTHKE